MLDHVFLPVSDVARSLAFYTAALAPLGIAHVFDYPGAQGPEGHPDLYGFGRDSRMFFWLRPGPPPGLAMHIGFVARSEAEVRATHAAALAAGAADVDPAGAKLHYDPRYYAATFRDPDGTEVEVVYKSWQHPA